MERGLRALGQARQAVVLSSSGCLRSFAINTNFVLPGKNIRMVEKEAREAGKVGQELFIDLEVGSSVTSL